ncbi:MAG: hypothetical protein ACRDDZ_01475 [Marinifilaceae bacterium]
MDIVKQNDMVGILSSTSSIVEQNNDSRNKASVVINNMLETIRNTPIQEDQQTKFLDDQVKVLIDKLKKTVKACEERRKPITQAFDEVRKYFTSIEADLLKGPEVSQLIAYRNNVAKYFAEQERLREQEREKQRQIQQERINVQSKVRDLLNASLNNQIEAMKQQISSLFNSLELSNFNTVSEKISGFKAECSLEIVLPASLYVTAKEISDYYNEMLPRVIIDSNDTFDKALLETKMFYTNRLSSKKEELMAIARASKEEAERIRKEAEEREKREAEARAKQKAELEAKQKAELEAQKTEQQVNAMFTENYASGPTLEVKKQLKIEVVNPAGWGQLFMFWFENEGKLLSNDKIEKKTLLQMKTFAEKHANKTGELINSPTLNYIEDVSAK